MSTSHGSSYARAWTIARTDLRQLRQARDFWMPLMIIASLFFDLPDTRLAGIGLVAASFPFSLTFTNEGNVIL